MRTAKIGPDLRLDRDKRLRVGIGCESKGRSKRKDGRAFPSDFLSDASTF